MKTLLFVIIFIFLVITSKAQRFYVEKADGGSEKVILDRMLEKGYAVTFNVDSADYILKANVKKMSMGRARGGILIINAKSGNIVGKTKDLTGSTRLANGFDNPVADVLRRVSKKYLLQLIYPLVTTK